MPREVAALCRRATELGSLAGAGQLRPEHTDVVRPAVGSGALGASGHVAMVAAVQPFVSGGVAKTVNLPPRATVEDVEAVFLEGWRRGLKGVTVYRQQSKILQPVRAPSDEGIDELPLARA